MQRRTVAKKVERPFEDERAGLAGPIVAFLHRFEVRDRPRFIGADPDRTEQIVGFLGRSVTLEASEEFVGKVGRQLHVVSFMQSCSGAATPMRRWPMFQRWQC